MTVFASLSFWVTFAGVLAGLLLAFVLHERGKRTRATQWRGVRPQAQARPIIVDVGTGSDGGRGTYVHFVTTDPQAYADIFVPSDRKG